MRFDYQRGKYYFSRENIIFLVHSLLTPFYVPRLPLDASMSATTLSPYHQQALHVTREIENLKNRKM